jgi:hypothetical protein
LFFVTLTSYMTMFISLASLFHKLSPLSLRILLLKMLYSGLNLRCIKMYPQSLWQLVCLSVSKNCFLRSLILWLLLVPICSFEQILHKLVFNLFRLRVQLSVAVPSGVVTTDGCGYTTSEDCVATGWINTNALSLWTWKCVSMKQNVNN